MNNNTITYYTLDEAREILRKEARQKRLTKKKKKEEEKERTLYFLKQKLMGLILIIISIVTPLITDGDATASLIVLPVGLFLVLTKEEAIYK